jgi:hypothetical protein
MCAASSVIDGDGELKAYRQRLEIVAATGLLTRTAVQQHVSVGGWIV